MSAILDYYFTSLSPFTYLGHRTFLQIAGQTPIHYRPVKLAQLFANSGALPPFKRPLCRQQYRLLELERWAKKRGLPMNLKPAHFPTDPALADRCVIALQRSGGNPAELVGLLLAACWAEEKDIADERVIGEILDRLSLDARALIQSAGSAEVEAEYEANTQQAIQQGVLGAPAYLYRGEQFWGQDRLELLAETLEATRESRG